MEVVNWPLIKHPMNWAIVILMVVIASIAFHFVVLHYQGSLGSQNSATT